MAVTLDRKLLTVFFLGALATLTSCHEPATTTVYTVELCVKTITLTGVSDLLSEIDNYAQSIHYARSPSAPYNSPDTPGPVSSQRFYLWTLSKPNVEDGFDSLEISFSCRSGEKTATITFHDYSGMSVTETQYSADVFRARLATRYPDIAVTVVSSSTPVH